MVDIGAKRSAPLTRHGAVCVRRLLARVDDWSSGHGSEFVPAASGDPHPEGCCLESSGLVVLDAIMDRIVHPGLDGGLAPAGAAVADLDVPGEGALVHLPIERRSAQAGSVENGVDPKNSVGGLGLHGGSLRLVQRDGASSAILNLQAGGRKVALE